MDDEEKKVISIINDYLKIGIKMRTIVIMIISLIHWILILKSDIERLNTIVKALSDNVYKMDIQFVRLQVKIEMLVR